MLKTFLLNQNVFSSHCKLLQLVSCQMMTALPFCTAPATNRQQSATSPPPTVARRLYGQPTSATHPHLLQNGEVSPGITRDEYGTRRRRLMQAIAQYAQHITLNTTHHLVVVPSATKVYMSEKIPFPFRQNSDFFYLTGFLEPDSVLVLLSESAVEVTDQSFRAIMFVQQRDPHSELWDGPRTGSDGAVGLLGVDEAYGVNELPNFLNSILRSEAGRSVALWYDVHGLHDDRHQSFVDRVLKAAVVDGLPKFSNSPRSLIQHLRLFKSPAEVALMAKSCEIASEAIIRTIASTDSRMTEHQLHAKVDYECRMRGADRLAYPPVVAGGSRATVIHYVANTQSLAEEDMVLMDAGCEYNGYVSDLTRTWPVARTFAPHHRTLYEAILDVQLELIRRCVERPSLDQLFHNMIDLLGRNLREVGIIDRMASKSECSKITHQYCPHHVSHYLGMDVHDTPLVPRSRALQPGMVITVEPGIYIAEDDGLAPSEFRGLGIRIEDNVLITKDGIQVLSESCPKTVSTIESIRKGANCSS